MDSKTNPASKYVESQCEVCHKIFAQPSGGNFRKLRRVCSQECRTQKRVLRDAEKYKILKNDPILRIEYRARYKKWLDNNPEKKSKYQQLTKSWTKIRKTEEKAMGRLASLAKLNSVSNVLSNSDLSQIKPKIHLKFCSFCGLQFQRGGPQDSPGRKTIYCSVKCKKDATKVRDARSHQNCRDRKLFEKYKRQIVFLGFLLTKKFKICLHPQPEISK
jgi:hypothetical protein